MDFPTMSLRTPSDVVAAIPYLFGFHPADSLVALGLAAKQIAFQARIDLPPPERVADDMQRLAAILRRQRVSRVLIVGYGTEPAVTPSVRALETELTGLGIKVPEMLRVADGKFWSYVCAVPACCDPAGVPFDVGSSVVATAATVAGWTVLPSRETLAARLEPVGGPAALDMRDALARAGDRLDELLRRPDTGTGELLGQAGRAAVDNAVLRMAYGGRLEDDDVAWLALMLMNVQVRDYAWERVGEDVALHVELWTEVTRRIDPELAAPPATLLAFASWRKGGGAIASIALDRALAADPDYAMARLLASAFEQGLGPREYVDLLEAREATADAYRRAPRPRRRSGRARVNRS